VSDDHRPKHPRERDENGAPEFYFYDECDCQSCCDERVAMQAFQDYAIARLGRCLSKAIRKGDQSQLDYLLNGAKGALRVWPYLPVRVQ
jgi:hypothetical protein